MSRAAKLINPVKAYLKAVPAHWVCFAEQGERFEVKAKQMIAQVTAETIEGYRLEVDAADQGCKSRYFIDDDAIEYLIRISGNTWHLFSKLWKTAVETDDRITVGVVGMVHRMLQCDTMKHVNEVYRERHGYELTLDHFRFCTFGLTPSDAVTLTAMRVLLTVPYEPYYIVDPILTVPLEDGYETRLIV